MTESPATPQGSETPEAGAASVTPPFSADEALARDWEAGLSRSKPSAASGLPLAAAASTVTLCRVVFVSRYDLGMRKVGLPRNAGSVWYTSRAAAIEAARFFDSLGQSVRIQMFAGAVEPVPAPYLKR
jgi:hypothetical protein